MRLRYLLEILLVGLLSLAYANSETSPPDTVKVTLKQGTISASKVDLVDGKFYYAFKNIPFAESPVGTRRFKESVLAGPWSGTRDGSIDPTPCPQFELASFFTGELLTIGDEDCLYLNVYTPKPYESDLPVMVWIHGGGFTLGSIGEYYPEPLLTKDVVVVSIQYRLGTLGFLSTEDSVIPGNLGMKDQVLGLRWVQQNIRDLGGDPTKVTIFGESAGGISVHFHMLSPMSAGLFQRAIAQSGTAIFPGFLSNHPREVAVALSQILECPGITPHNFRSEDFYNCLQGISSEKLVTMAHAFVEFFTSPQVMLPSVDGDFLPQHPTILMREGRYNKVDFMTGATKDEGAIVVGPLILNRPMIDNLVANFTTHGPTILLLEKEDESRVYVAKRIFYHYLQDLNITNENKHQALKMFGDLMFTIPMDISGKLHARDAAYGKNVFLYEFHHRGLFSLFDFMNITIEDDWVCHGDDLRYLFKLPTFSIETELNAKDKFMSDIMVTLWTNFAKTGNPTPDLSLGFRWTPVSDPEKLSFLILNTSPYMQKYTREEEFLFWTNLPFKHNKRLFSEKFE